MHIWSFPSLNRCISGLSSRTLLATSKNNLEPVLTTFWCFCQLTLTVLLGDQEADAQLAPVSGHAGLEVYVVGLDTLLDSFHILLLGLLELFPEAGGRGPCLDGGFDQATEVGDRVTDGVCPGYLLDQTEPAPGLRESGRLWKVGDVPQDALAGLHTVRGHPEPIKLDLMLAELELLLIECYSIVPTEPQIIEDVEEVSCECVVVQECVIHHLALILDVPCDVICPSSVGVPRIHVSLGGSAVP